MDSIPLDAPEKQCTACGATHPATKDFFHPRKHGKYGLQAMCKPCINERNAALRSVEKELPPPGTVKICSICNKPWEATTDFFHREKGGKYGLSAICKTCRSEKDKAKYKANPEKINARNNAWHKAHREQSTIALRAWRAANPEKNLEYSRKYEAMPKCQEYRRKFRDMNREHLNLRSRIYRAAHKEAYRAHSSTRRARKKHIPGSYTQQDVQVQHKRQKGKCYYCQRKLVRYHVDHVIPVTREGSSNEPWNLVLACPRCNQRKGNKLPHEWFEGGRLM